MDFPPKKLLVAGDRVLIKPEEGEERTKVGLYLPATAVETQQVQEGLIVATGVGDPLPDVSAFDEEPWKVDQKTPRFHAEIPIYVRRIGRAAISFWNEPDKHLFLASVIVSLIRWGEDSPLCK